MDDKTLADAVVALGVGKIEGEFYVMPHYPDTDDMPLYLARGFVRDWRVAGALMEKLQDAGHTIICDFIHAKPWIRTYGLSNEPVDWEINESLPRAIIEACVEALNG